MKYFTKLLVLILISCLPQYANAVCSVHDQVCRYHSIGSQSAHIGTQQVHHTKGVQDTVDIANTPNGLYMIGVWDDNSSGLKADLDLDVLLPEAAFDNQGGVLGAGPYVVSNNAAFGGADATSDPFDGIAGEHDRHVNTFQYQTTFSNNTATATHSKDANGIAPIPNAQECIAASGSDSCEHVQIRGNIPDAIYQAALTNYDINNLSDASTPQFHVYAYFHNDPSKPNAINGDIYYLDQSSELSGSMMGKGDVSERFRVGFQNRDFNPHAEGVVLDNYQTRHASGLKKGRAYQRKQGNYLNTYQNLHRDYWAVNRQEKINASGQVYKKVNLGEAAGSRRNNVFVGTNLVSSYYVAPPPPPIQIVSNNGMFSSVPLSYEGFNISGAKLKYVDPTSPNYREIIQQNLAKKEPAPVYGPAYTPKPTYDKYNAQLHDSTSYKSKFEKFSGEYTTFNNLNIFEKSLYKTVGTLDKFSYDTKSYVNGLKFEFLNNSAEATTNFTTGFVTGIPDAVNGVMKVGKYVNPIYYSDKESFDESIALVDKITPAAQGYVEKITDGYYDPNSQSNGLGEVFSPLPPVAVVVGKIGKANKTATITEESVELIDNGVPITNTIIGEVSGKLSQKQLRHIKGRNEYRGGGYFNDIEEAQEVLDAFKENSTQILGTNSSGFPVVRYNEVTGTNVNIGAGITNQPTNVFIIKGTKHPSVVPANPNWNN